MSGPGARELGAADAIDRRQVRTLVVQRLRQTFRPGIDVTTGMRVTPLRQLVMSMTFAGVIVAINAGRMADLRSYFVVVFAFVAGILACSILPESWEIRQRSFDILYSKPVSGPTFAAAWAVGHVVTLSTLVTFLTLPMLVAARLTFGGPWWVECAALGAIILMGLAVTIPVVLLLRRLATRYETPRLRRVAQALLAIFVFGAMAVSFSASGGDGPVSLAPYWWLRLIPSTWFADALVGGHELMVHGERAAAALLVALAAALVSQKGLGTPQDLDDRLLQGQTARSVGFGLRLLVACRRVGVGRRLVSEPVFGVAALVLSVGGREESTRLKLMAPRLILIGAAAISLLGLVGDGGHAVGIFGVPLLAYVGLSQLNDAVSILLQSSSPGAAWPFRAAPVAPLALLRGARMAILLRHFLAPLMLLGFVVAMEERPLVAALLGAGYLAEGSLLVSILLLVRPGLPLAADATSTPGVLGTAGAMIVGLLSTVFYMTFYVAVTTFSTFGETLGALLVLAAIGLELATRRWASRRIARLEYAQ